MTEFAAEIAILFAMFSKTTRRALSAALPALALTTLLAASAREDAPSFAPESGLVLVKTFEHHVERTIADIEVTMNGESQEIPEVPDVSIVDHEVIVVSDTYSEVEDGRTLELERTFVSLGNTQTVTSDEEDREEDETSELEETTVVFTWDADDEEYSVAFAEDEDGDEDLLDELVEDMDLRAFLPDSEVDEGDTWTVGVEGYHVLASPGGELAILGEDGEADEEREFREGIRDNMDGEWAAEWQGTRDEDGTTVGVIALTGEFTSEAEVSFEPEDGITVTRGAELELSLEGELLWDMEAGHFYAANLQGTFSLPFTEQTEIDRDEFQGELVNVTTFDGEMTWEISAETGE